MSSDYIEELIRQGENTSIEFKRGDVRTENLAKELIAFSNSSGGVVLLGIDDNYVFRDRGQLYAIEVKSGRKKSGKGLAAFCQQVPHALRVILTPDNFAQFSADPRAFLRKVAV